MARKITNNKTGETITTTMSDMNAAIKFASNAGDDHWLWFWIHKATAEASAPNYTEGLTVLKHMFTLAIGYGLKKPKLRIIDGHNRFTLYLSARGTMCIKKAMKEMYRDAWGSAEYVGCIYQGKYLKSRVITTVSPAVEKFLEELRLDPLGYMARQSQAANECCYCGKALDTEDSRAVGYGPACAKRWGLPWGGGTAANDSQSFIDQYDDNARQLFDAVLRDRHNASAWEAVTQWLQSVNLPAVNPPAATTVLPQP